MRTGDLINRRYRLETLLGAGGNGVVWSAFDTTLERMVALKRPHSMQGDAERIVFRREAKNAARVQHPNSISVFDAVDTDDCWLVMEYLPAQSLDKILAAHGPLPPERVARIGLQIAAALHAAHSKDLVHRDVKPGNVLVSDNDLAKLTDFGISVWREVTLTGDGKVSGTPAYVAPEVANGLPATPASDMFSLGATLFAAVEGASPFGGGTPDAVLARARRGQIADMHRAGPLATLLAEMLDGRAPLNRPTADAVRHRLEEFLGARGPTPPTLVPAADAGVVAPADANRKKRRLRWRALAAAAAIGVVVVATFAIARSIDPSTTSAQSAKPTSTSPPRTSSSTHPTTATSTTTVSTPSITPQPAPPPPTPSTRQSSEPATQPPAAPPPAPTCRQREQYQVTVRGEVHDAAGNVLGVGEEGDLFVRLDTPPNPPTEMADRFYGTVNGATGYFLQRKLDYVGPVSVCG